jgi:uncharacterized membrane protein
MIKMFGPPWVRRTILALISFLIVMLGAATLFHGKLEYYNWWGGIIFAPFAIIIGSLGLVIAAFKPNVFEETARKKAASVAGRKDEAAISEDCCLQSRFR